MALAPGSHRLGPEVASLQVKTYREGMAARVGHDLVLDVTRWEATVEIAADPAGSAVELSADPRSIEVREGVRGVKPLTGKDRVEILRNIDEQVLHGQPIAFRSSAVRLTDGETRLLVEGDLEFAGETRPITARPEQLGHQALPRPDGRAEGARRGRGRDRGAAAGVARGAPRGRRVRPAPGITAGIQGRVRRACKTSHFRAW